jgi:hypothetical protein
VRRLVALVLLAGCGPAPHAPFAPCPIQEAQCRVDTFLALEGERGQLLDPWARPPDVSVISVAELQRRLDLLRALTLGSDAWDPWTEPLRDLGLLSPGLTVVDSDKRWEAENTGAFYWSRDKEITVIDRGAALDDVSAVSLLTHEYTHAAQDREFRLRFGLDWQTTDQELVRVTLVEGEAELYGLLARLRMEGPDPAGFASDQYFRDWLRTTRDQTAVVDSPHTHVRLSLPYPTGGLLMARAWLRGRSPAVNQVLLHAPDSFAAILRAIEDRPAPGPPRPLCHRVIPLDQFLLLGSDRLGAGLLYGYLVRAFGDEAAAWQAAFTWNGDQLWALRDRKGGQSVTFWNVHTVGLRDTPLGAQLAASAGSPRLVGDDLLVWTGLDAATALALHQSTSCGR